MEAVETNIFYAVFEMKEKNLNIIILISMPCDSSYQTPVF